MEAMNPGNDWEMAEIVIPEKDRIIYAEFLQKQDGTEEQMEKDGDIQ